VQLFDLKGRGLSIGARLAAGDGALGFWNALAKVYGYTRWQSLDFRYRRAPEGH
jgi:putative transposase